MDTDCLRYETDNEPCDVYDFEKEHPPPATLADALDGMWTGQLREIDDGTVTVEEGTMSMILTRAGDKLSGAIENYTDILDVEGTVTENREVVFTITWADYAVVCTGRYDAVTDTITGFWEAKEDEDSSEDSDSDEDDSDSSYESSESDSDSGSNSESTSGSEEGEDDEDAEDDEEAVEEVSEEVDGKEGGEKESDWVDEEATTEVVAEKDGDGEDSASSPESSSQPFVFCRTPAAAYRFRYTDAQFTQNPARARWRFAIAATIDQVQRTHISWPYLKKRFAERKRYVELTKRENAAVWKYTPWTPLDDDEEAELQRLKVDLQPCDARFYDAVVDFEQQKVVS